MPKTRCKLLQSLKTKNCIDVTNTRWHFLWTMFSACTSIKVAALLNKIADLPKEHFSPLDPILYFQLLFLRLPCCCGPVPIAGWYRHKDSQDLFSFVHYSHDLAKSTKFHLLFSSRIVSKPKFQKPSKIFTKYKDIRPAQVNIPMYEINSEIHDPVIDPMPNIWFLLKAVSDDSILPYEKCAI